MTFYAGCDTRCCDLCGNPIEATKPSCRTHDYCHNHDTTDYPDCHDCKNAAWVAAWEDADTERSQDR